MNGKSDVTTHRRLYTRSFTTRNRWIKMLEWLGQAIESFLEINNFDCRRRWTYMGYSGTTWLLLATHAYQGHYCELVHFELGLSTCKWCSLSHVSRVFAENYISSFLTATLSAERKLKYCICEEAELMCIPSPNRQWLYCLWVVSPQNYYDRAQRYPTYQN